MQVKKSLGQHFLTSRGALMKIVEVSDLQPTDTVLEIGPGRGMLTEELLKHAKQVIAVEKDRELTLWLEIKFSAEIRAKKLVLINEDILKYDPAKITGDYKLVANIPYNITGAIIEQFLTTKKQPSLMTLLVQKEVAERIVGSPRRGGAGNQKESILSLSVKAYGEPKYVQTVKAGSFNPPPKVDSAILSITDISRTKFKQAKTTEKDFFQVMKAGFAHKRKTISNNLKTLGEKGVSASDNFEKCGVRPTDRAEDLTLDQWLCLAGQD